MARFSLHVGVFGRVSRPFCVLYKSEPAADPSEHILPSSVAATPWQDNPSPSQPPASGTRKTTVLYTYRAYVEVGRTETIPQHVPACTTFVRSFLLSVDDPPVATAAKASVSYRLALYDRRSGSDALDEHALMGSVRFVLADIVQAGAPVSLPIVPPVLTSASHSSSQPPSRSMSHAAPSLDSSSHMASVHQSCGQFAVNGLAGTEESKPSLLDNSRGDCSIRVSLQTFPVHEDVFLSRRRIVLKLAIPVSRRREVPYPLISQVFELSRAGNHPSRDSYSPFKSWIPLYRSESLREALQADNMLAFAPVVLPEWRLGDTDYELRVRILFYDTRSRCLRPAAVGFTSLSHLQEMDPLTDSIMLYGPSADSSLLSRADASFDSLQRSVEMPRLGQVEHSTSPLSRSVSSLRTSPPSPPAGLAGSGDTASASPALSRVPSGCVGQISLDNAEPTGYGGIFTLSARFSRSLSSFGSTAAVPAPIALRSLAAAAMSAGDANSFTAVDRTSPVSSTTSTATGVPVSSPASGGKLPSVLLSGVQPLASSTLSPSVNGKIDSRRRSSGVELSSSSGSYEVQSQTGENAETQTRLLRLWRMKSFDSVPVRSCVARMPLVSGENEAANSNGLIELPTRAQTDCYDRSSRRDWSEAAATAEETKGRIVDLSSASSGHDSLPFPPLPCQSVESGCVAREDGGPSSLRRRSSAWLGSTPALPKWQTSRIPPGGTSTSTRKPKYRDETGRGEGGRRRMGSWLVREPRAVVKKGNEHVHGDQAEGSLDRDMPRWQRAMVAELTRQQQTAPVRSEGRSGVPGAFVIPDEGKKKNAKRKPGALRLLAGVHRVWGQHGAKTGA